MTLDRASLATGQAVRAACRYGVWTGPTAGLARGFAQANLVIVGQDAAADFAEFCRRNPRPCPLLEVSAPGDPEPKRLALGADLRTDLPRYRVLRDGRCVDRPVQILDVWRDDCVAFLLGCSFTFESALEDAGVPVRHLEEGRNVPMYRTNIECAGVGPFVGPMVVSMRPMSPDQAERASAVTARFPHFHGGPLHVGAPEAIGIADLTRPDYGESVTVQRGELPVFWACGVTPLEAVLRAKLDLAATHEPGCMFVTDKRDHEVLGDECH